MKKRVTRSVVTAALAAAGLVVAGCSDPGGAETPPTSEKPKEPALKSFDACTALTPQELQERGLPPKGEPKDQGIGEVGCEFAGDDTLVLLKDEEADRAYWNERKGNFAEFEPNQIGDHPGFRSVTNASKGQGICSQTIFAGGGSVTAQFAFDVDKMAGKDPCAKAIEFAELIEPRLPK